MEGFLRYELGGFYLEGLIHGGAYFRNFTVFLHVNSELGLQHPKTMSKKLQNRLLKSPF